MRNIFFITAITILISCVDRYDKPPENLIPQEEMRDLLIDIHLTEVYVEREYPQRDSALSFYKTLEPQLLEKHKISKAQFDTSYSYYARNMELMDEIYTEVVDSLGKLESLLNVKGQNQVNHQKKFMQNSKLNIKKPQEDSTQKE